MGISTPYGCHILKPSVVVAGASGYIGKAIIPKLLEQFPEAQIIALSRSQQHSDDARVVWKACDLFSLKSIEDAIPKKVDLALYLVHSMGPTAHLDQGSFADYDLILADNFARALKKAELKQLIYLGGLIPETKNMSLHLQSRMEVEETFSQYKLPTTVFRAGLILGEAGSSFQILLKLVKRLPVMICPKWTQTLTSPVDLETVLKSITASALNANHIGRTYDLAGCMPLTYLQMMRETAKHIGKNPKLFTVPFFTPTLSRLWVSLITNTSKDLVYPLIESLEHQMVARENNLFSKESIHRSYRDLLQNVSMKTRHSMPFFKFKAQRKSVRSVQRLSLPLNQNAQWVQKQYFEWLPKFLAPMITVRPISEGVVFSLLNTKIDLLELKFNHERSNDDRTLCYVIRGLMVAKDNRGRLEFRVVLNRRFVLAAIHDYRPSLPWYIYVFTQAKLHLFVMNSFAKYISEKS